MAKENDDAGVRGALPQDAKMNLADPVGKWATLEPGKIALIDIPRDQRVTYKQFQARIVRLANGFLSLRLVKGDCVAILSTNNIEYFEIYYACALMGLIAQPLNWRLSATEIAKILDDGKPAVFAYLQDFDEVKVAVQQHVTDPDMHYLDFGVPGSTYESLISKSSSAAPGLDRQ